TKANPEIDFPASPFFVNAAVREWVQNGSLRRAGVMSTGMGGTNAHVVLEEAPEPVPVKHGDGPHLLLLSAKTPTALGSIARNLADFLTAQASPNLSSVSAIPSSQALERSHETNGAGSLNSGLLANVAYTLQKGRSRFSCRRFVVCNHAQDAAAALKAAASK